MSFLITCLTMERNSSSRLLSVKEVRLILPISSWKIVSMAHDGTLPSVPIGRKFYFDIVDVLELRQRGTAAPVKQSSNTPEEVAL